MPMLGRGLAILITTAGLMLLFATIFDGLWWTATKVADTSQTATQQSNKDIPRLTAQQQHGDAAAATSRNPKTGRLTLEHCEAAYLHPDAGAPIPAHVGRIVDGDTIEVFVAGKPHTVRLWGIDAPEKDQTIGQASHDLLELIARPGSTIDLHPVDTDTYGRTVAVAGYRDVPAVNFQMVQTGMAYQSEWPDAQTNRCLTVATRLAQDSQTGIWADSSEGGIRPWDHRKSP